MSLLNRNWRYHTASESAQPGYLKRRLDCYRKRDAERAKEAERVVKPLVRAKV